MTETTVTEAPTEEPPKKASELKVGDWVTNVINVQDEVCGPARVAYLKPFYGNLHNRVHLVLDEVDEAEPQTAHLLADDEVELLSDADVERLKEAGRRRQVATRLRELADLIVLKDLPLPGPYNAPTVSFSLGRDVAAVERAAEALGLQVECRNRSVDLWLTNPGEDSTLTVHWSAYGPEPKPTREPEPEPADSVSAE